MKQETIKEAAKQSDKSKCKHFRREHTKEEVYDSFEEGFIEGAEWQKQRMYSEEEVKKIAEEVRWQTIGDPMEFTKNFEKWFKQFKKK